MHRITKFKLENSTNFGCSEFSFSPPTLGCMETLHPRLSISPETHSPKRRQGSAEKQSNLRLFFFCRLRNINTSTGAESFSLSSSNRFFTLSVSIWSSAGLHLTGVYWLHDILWLFFDVFATKPSTNDQKLKKVTLDFYTEFHCMHSGYPLSRPCSLLY